jgi:hypothetical protein
LTAICADIALIAPDDTLSLEAVGLGIVAISAFDAGFNGEDAVFVFIASTIEVVLVDTEEEIITLI